MKPSKDSLLGFFLSLFYNVGKGGVILKIGKTIQSIRTGHQLSQEQFAQIFHVTRQTISNWENEKSYPDLQSLINMSDRFHISLDDMLKDSPEIVRYMDKKKHTVRWLLMTIFLLILLLSGMFQYAFKPTPHHQRNLPDDLPTMYLNLPQATPSRAIVRSFTAKDFGELDSHQLKKIYDEVDGRIEGDIPPLRLREGNELRFVFQNTQRDNLQLQNPPYIRIFSQETVFYEGESAQDKQGWFLPVKNDWSDEVTTIYLECHYADVVSLTAFYLVP